MSFLVTGDFQAEWNNLDLCKQAWDEVLGICKERKVDKIVFAGDGKQAYNPVDIRVVRWWQSAIERAKRHNVQVLYLLGNHDRVGQFTGADNWLPILRRAGALTFDVRGVYRDDDVRGVHRDASYRIFFLPFSKVARTKVDAKRLLRYRPDKTRDVLIFHCDIQDAKYNKLGMKSDAPLSISDLHSDRYRFCIGGHIHLPQLVEGNVYYVGSPYCTDWGEANQRKRYILVADSGLSSIRSNIPGWYNPSWPDFNESEIDSFRDARIKIEVQVNADDDYGRVLDSTREQAERKYRGATIYVVPKFRDSDQKDVGISSTDSDERKIREYVKQTCTNRRIRKSCIPYMVAKIGEFGGRLRKESRVKFLLSKGKRFLSFKDIEVDYREKGITLIEGINLDRMNRSNGSGKTSISQVIPVALFGRTFKEQTHDRWANRFLEGSATAQVTMMDSNHHKIKVIRGRRPPLLQMLVDGKDKSSGMRSTDRDGTQLQIEQRTGFTWQTLANAVYIDRSVADAFLSGTKKQRTELLSRFQNLERFSKALELVRKDKKKNSKSLHHIGHEYERVMGSMEDCQENLNSLKAMAQSQLDAAYGEFQKNKKDYKTWKRVMASSIRKLEKQAKVLDDKYDFASRALSNVTGKLAVVKSDCTSVGDELRDWKELSKLKECPTCFQPVSKIWVKRHGKEINVLYEELCKKRNVLLAERANWLKKSETLDGRKAQIEIDITDKEHKGRILKMSLQTTEKQYSQLFSDQHNANTLVGKTENKLKEYKKSARELKDTFEKLRRKEKMYDYVIEAFSRDGIPAFLNRQLCPILNKAADYYAELFSDRDVQVKFSVDEGEFVPQVINAKGGEGIDDQSTGERALAGLIASFALREVAPKCNVLILDEPGEGLDSQTARQFAKALLTLKKRFGSIWIATHNQIILSELSGERIVTVRKKNRISKLVA